MRSALLTSLSVVSLALAASPAGAQGAVPEGASAPPVASAPPAASAAATALPGASALPSGWAPPLRINYTVEVKLSAGAGTRSCPDEEYLHQEVARQVGYDPLIPDPSRTPIGRFHFSLTHTDDGYTSKMEYFKLDGTLAWSVPAGFYNTCTGLFKRLAFTISRVLTVRAGEEPDPAPSPALAAPPTPAPAPAAPPAPPPAVEPPQEPARRVLRLRGEAGLGLLGAFGIAPAPTLGGVVHLGLGIFPQGFERPWLSLAVKGRLDKPAAGGAYGQQPIQTQLLAASVLVCGHTAVFARAFFDWSFFGCGIATVGAMRGGLERGDGLGSSGGTYVGMGAGPGIEARLGIHVAVRLHSDVLATVKPARVVVPDAGEGWQVRSASFNVGLAALFFFGDRDGSGSSR